MKRNRWPIFSLILLSPTIGELLSSSSPPLEFFQPLTFIILMSLYGTGALLSREAWVRWGGGPYTLLLLGAAYGIVEEGVMTRSFFCPTWPDLGILAEYGRWIGVNWVWAIHLTIFYAVFSISIPIMLVGLTFSDLKDRPWLGSKGVIISLLVLSSVIFLGIMGISMQCIRSACIPLSCINPCSPISFGS